jgi:hypothetical protein
MNLEDPASILIAYEKICAGMEERIRLPAMQLGGYQLQADHIADPDALWDTIKQQLPIQGWLQFQSWQGIFSDHLPMREDHWGYLLAAEAVTADGLSLTIAQDGRGGWILSRYQHLPDIAGIWDKVQHLTHDGQVLIYRRYWHLDPEQGYLQERACFMGLAKKAGETQ